MSRSHRFLQKFGISPNIARVQPVRYPLPRLYEPIKVSYQAPRTVSEQLPSIPGLLSITVPLA